MIAISSITFSSMEMPLVLRVQWVHRVRGSCVCCCLRGLLLQLAKRCRVSTWVDPLPHLHSQSSNNNNNRTTTMATRTCTANDIERGKTRITREYSVSVVACCKASGRCTSQLNDSFNQSEARIEIDFYLICEWEANSIFDVAMRRRQISIRFN